MGWFHWIWVYIPSGLLTLGRLKVRETKVCRNTIRHIWLKWECILNFQLESGRYLKVFKPLLLPRDLHHSSSKGWRGGRGQYIMQCNKVEILRAWRNRCSESDIEGPQNFSGRVGLASRGDSYSTPHSTHNRNQNRFLCHFLQYTHSYLPCQLVRYWPPKNEKGLRPSRKCESWRDDERQETDGQGFQDRWTT